jgi:hypothetical protein
MKEEIVRRFPKMAINKEDVIKLFEQLPEKEKQSAFDYMQYLTIRDRPDWTEIAQFEPDDIPLSDEEVQQLNAKEGMTK